MFKDCRTRKRQCLAISFPNPVLTRIRFSRGADAGLTPFRELSLDLFLTIDKALDRSLAGLASHESKAFSMPRNATCSGTFSSFQLSINAQSIGLSNRCFGATSDESVFDFGKVIEVVQLRTSKSNVQSPTSTSRFPTLDFGH